MTICHGNRGVILFWRQNVAEKALIRFGTQFAEYRATKVLETEPRPTNNLEVKLKE